jgi:monoamine oxidase
LGATWLGKKHTALVALLKELDLPIFEQYMGPAAIYEPISTSPPQVAQLPPNPDPSYRIAGGSSALIQKLAATFDESRIQLETVVTQLKFQQAKVLVETNQGVFSARTVVSTLPPRLLTQKVRFAPALPVALTKIAAETHTWMGESIKVGLRYAQPFWRKPHTSGSIFSNVGPVTEMYDHSDESVSYFALKGFLNGSFQSATPTYRRGILLKQLERYYGQQVYDFLSYEEWVWSQEPYTYTPYEGYILPHQYNGHEVYRQAYWDGHLYLAGSETAEQYPGYMDGAVRSAYAVSKLLLRNKC